MRIIIAGDNNGTEAEVASVIRKAAGDAELSVFNAMDSTAEAAAKEICLLAPDIIFIDMSAGIADVMDLIGMLKKRRPEAGVVLVAEDSSLTLKAFEAHVQGYIVKPVTEASACNEIEYYRQMQQVARSRASLGGSAGITATAFGLFDFKLNGRPVHLKRLKTGELLAFLIDNGGSVVPDNAILEALWGKANSSTKSNLRSLKAELIEVLRDAGCEDAIIKQRGMLGIRADMVSCDYLDALKADPPDLHRYHGEYMSQFHWSENTKRKLDDMKARQTKSGLDDQGRAVKPGLEPRGARQTKS